MGNGLRLRFASTSRPSSISLSRAAPESFCEATAEPGGPDDGPRSHQTLLLDFGENRARIGVLGLQIGQHYLALVGVHDGTVSEIKPDGSIR